MKFLDCPELSVITSSLDDTIFGDHRVRGQAEAYSCKLAGEDKHLLKEISHSDAKENLVSVHVSGFCCGSYITDSLLPLSLCVYTVRMFGRGSLVNIHSRLHSFQQSSRLRPPVRG